MSKIFISYCHKDNAFMEEILAFLKCLEKEGHEIWTDKKLAAGEIWDDEIKRKIKDTDITLAIVSQAFLNSSYCTDVEIKQFIEQNTTIISVIYSPCEWNRHEWLKTRAFIPSDNKTIEEHHKGKGKRQRILLEILKAVRTQIEKISCKNSKTILVLTANPKQTKLKLDKEFCEIYENLQNEKNFDIKLHQNINIRDFQTVVRETKPFIVHFSGHGLGESGIACQDDHGNLALVSSDALEKLFLLCNNYVKCVVINACYSEIQAKAISYHVDYVIGMKQAINHNVAITFLREFYRALGNNEPIESAFNYGCNAIRFNGFTGHDIPFLIRKTQKPVHISTVSQSLNNRFIYLAEVSDDINKLRSEIKQYLEQQNFNVLPDKIYSFQNAENLHQAIDNDLQKSILFVQLLSDLSPARPQGMATPLLQYERSKAFPHLPVLQWRDDIPINPSKIEDQKHLQLLNSSDVIISSLQSFRPMIIQKLNNIVMEQKQARQNQSTKDLVFINADINVSEDIALAYEIQDVLFDNNMEVVLPLKNVPSSDIQKCIECYVLECDSVIILYYMAHITWVQEQLLYCRRVRAKRDKPLKIMVIYDKPTDNTKPSIEGKMRDFIMLHCPEHFVESCLPRFLEQIRRPIYE